MEWNELLKQFAQRPLFHSSMLKVFPEPISHIRVQLSRWVRSGKLKQIRRGWYIIEEPWRTTDVPISLIANSVVHPSYLSLDWALQYYDMIPEYVPNPTSVTTQRGIRFPAQGALFLYYHVQPVFFKGFNEVRLDNHKVFIATPEKALLDKMYLFMHRNRFSIDWLHELRLQSLENFDIELFKMLAKDINKKSFREAVEATAQYIGEMN
jgi:hypothetical protein